MMRWLFLSLVLFSACGCVGTSADVWHNIILPEQRTLAYRDPIELPGVPLPPSVAPATVSNPRPEASDWKLSLDEAIRIALDHSRVVRVLTGITAVSSGKTIYDPTVTNTTIDQEQARFDPVLSWNNQWSRTNTPTSQLDPFSPGQSIFTSNPTDAYLSTAGLSWLNTAGGKWGANWVENPARFPGGGPLNPFLFAGSGLALNPQTASHLELSYTQPLLQGAGFRVNTAPIVIARLNTEISFFQYKDSVQELVRGVSEAYWNLVQARLDMWARKKQVEFSEEAYKREQTRLEFKLGDSKDVAQAKVTYYQFNASLIAAKANVLVREGALRNILGLPPSDERTMVPTSVPKNQELKPDWDRLVRLAEERRPDIIELKLILEAEQQRLLQAENQVLPRLDGVALYRWNGLSGVMPNGDSTSTAGGKYADWTLGINFSVPLGLRQGRAQVRQERLLIDRDRANLHQGLHAAIHELTITVRNLDSAYMQYQAYKETRKAAEINLDVQNERFKANLSIYLTVLQAINDWGNAITSEAGALLSYNIALATLERQTGTILEEHGLVFHEERFRAAGPLGRSHPRQYPAAIVPGSTIDRHQGLDEPSENSFELRNPAPRKTKANP